MMPQGLSERVVILLCGRAVFWRYVGNKDVVGSRF